MRAREAVRQGALRLAERPGRTATGALCGALAGLVGAAAAATARTIQGAGAAAALLAAGGLLAAFIAATGIAIAVGPEPDRRRGRAPDRGAAVLVLQIAQMGASTTLLLLALLPALLFAAVHNDAPPIARAAGVTFAAGPALLLLALGAPAFAVAIGRAAAGVSVGEALADGLRAGLLGLPSLIATLGAAAIASAPLWLLSIALGGAVAASHNAAAIAGAEALRGALGLLVAGWVYAALLCAVRVPTPPDPAAA